MKKIKFTPDNIQELEPDSIFVFGSNLPGNHAGGAARFAVEKFGAINGQAIGLQGQSYAIPTLDKDMNKISVDLLLSYLTGLNLFASENKDKIFYVTKIGCGIAGFDEIEIARLFQSIQWSKNVILPRLFADAKLTDFIIKLKNNNYSYHFEDDKLIVDKIGSVDLRSLTSLPEGVTFSNGGSVDLSSLTSLPEGVTFSNGGYVDLSSLTSLPEGVTFSNGGSVDLSSLTSLPEGVTFSNGGSVDLSSLTSLPEGVTFSNGGNVDLRSLTSLPEGVTFSNGGYVYLSSLTSLPEGVTFSNGGYVDLSSLTSLPEGVTFSNGGSVYLSSGKKEIKTPYLKRFNIPVKENKVILYKRVSSDFKTQEDQRWETIWKVGAKLTHPNWNPSEEECGKGKFHACAKPGWCDEFRNKKGDRYIAIEVHVKDLYEWTDNPNYPTKIAFREGTVLYECDRKGNKI
ncbi:MAG: hypothetical protein LBQ74_13765 [Prevotella sp.]|jgi:hypothetical protein|nr:hypothetical protein [Prevotella sp.]